MTGNPAKGYSSDQALDAIEEVAEESLPADMGYEWSNMSYQEKQVGSEALMVFALAIVLVFLVLAAQYESWANPVAVILVVPLAVLGTVAALVMRGFGGINVETIHDVVYALPPFDRITALRLLDSLKLRPLLDGLRDRPAVDVEAFCLAAERFSIMAAALGGVISEIDVNPVIVHSQGCIAVDALVVGYTPDSGG